MDGAEGAARRDRDVPERVDLRLGGDGGDGDLRLPKEGGEGEEERGIGVVSGGGVVDEEDFAVGAHGDVLEGGDCDGEALRGGEREGRRERERERERER